MKLSKLIAKKIIKAKARQIPKIEKPVETKELPIAEKKPEIISEEPIPSFRKQETGLRLPQIPTELTEIRVEQKPLIERAISYPLIPRKPAKGEPVYAYAKIFWDSTTNKYVYQLVEPQLTNDLLKMFKKIKELLEERLDVDFTKLKKIEAKDYLSKQMDEIIKIFRFRISENDKQILKYYIERDFTGLGKIEPLMQDPNIEDISCDGLGVPIFLFHRDPNIGSIITNIVFDDPDELDSFIIRLAQLCGKSISVAQPLLDGSLPDGSRLQATLATDIARRGSNFCIKEGFVQLADGTLEDIKNLFNTYKVSYGCIKDEYGNEIVIPKLLKVRGIDETSLNEEEARVLKIIKLRPPQKLVKIEFKESGKTTSSIEVTENHKFHVVTSEGIKTIPASKLTANMWIPVPTKINVSVGDFNKFYLSLVEKALLSHQESKVYVKINDDIRTLLTYLDTYKSRLKDIKRGRTSSITFEELLKILDKSGKSINIFPYVECMLRRGEVGRGSKIKIPLTFTEDFAYLLGWIIGDGHITEDNINIDTGLSDRDKQRLLNMISNVFGVRGKCYGRNTNRIYINSKILSSFLNTVFSLPIGKKARKVTVPRIIEISSNNIIANFLKGLFESNGSFKTNINLITFSEELANKIIFLLARLGIYSRLNKSKESFRIFIPAEYYHEFSVKITTNKYIQELIKKHRFTRNSKMLPAFFVKSLFDLLRKNKVKWDEISKIINITDILKIGRVSFQKIKELNEYAKKFGENELTKLVDYLTSGRFEFMEISDVKIRDNIENSPVYDIECNPVNFYIGGKNRPLFLHDSIRKFSEEPLTPVHLLNYGTTDIATLAYLWFIVDYGRSILVSGGTASGKTTFLNVLSLFIRPEKKIVSIEDTPELRLPHTHWVPSVARTPISAEGLGEVDLFELLKGSLRQRPDYIVVGEVRGKEAYILFQQMASIPSYEKVMVLNDNHLKVIPIAEIKSNKPYMIPTIDLQSGKVKISPLRMKVEHMPVKELYKIITKTGREAITTGNHSLFMLTDKIEPITVSELKENDKIVILARLPSGYNDIDYLNLIELLPDIRVYSPELIKKATRKLGFEKASEVGEVSCISHYYGVNNCALLAKKFKKLMKKAGIDYTLAETRVRFERKSPLLSAKLEITPELLRLLGYYISEGSLNTSGKNNSICLYSNNEKILEDMRKCILEVCGKTPRERTTYGTSIELKFNHKTIFEILKRFCGYKSNRKIPEFIFGLSKKKIGQFLSALFTGDGYFGERYFAYYTISKKLAEDISNLLLVLGIVSHVRKRKRINRKNYDYEIKFYRKNEMETFLKFVKPISKKIKLKKEGKTNPRIKGDIYLDSIKSIKKLQLKKPVMVYDLSVPGTQNFINKNGILLHNTGHPSLATIHSENLPKLMDRLTTPPISLPPALIKSVDLIVFLARMRYKDKFTRKVVEVLEVVDFDVSTNLPIVNTVLKWNPVTDTFDLINNSILLKRLSELSGMTGDEITKEIEKRMVVLGWMKKNNITDYRDVYKIFSVYYADPKKLLTIIRGGGV